MAYNKQDITSYSLSDTVTGSLIRVPGGFTTPPGLDWDPADEPTAEYLGEVGESGVSVEISADDTDKITMDRNHGKVYSNYLTTSTLRFASATDRDVLSTVFGDGNTTTVAGGTKTVFSLKQPGNDGYIVLGKTDDGRPYHLVIEDGKIDPNISFELVNTEITVYEANVLASSGDAYVLVGDDEDISA